MSPGATAISLLPLFFGIWCAFFPETVPQFLLKIPVYLFEVIGALNRASNINSRAEDDWRNDFHPEEQYRSSAVGNFDMASVRVIGWVVMVIWVIIAVIVHRHYAAVAAHAHR
jgi:hypothetical protein